MDPHTAPSRAHTSVRRNYVLTVPNQKYQRLEFFPGSDAIPGLGPLREGREDQY